MRVVKDTMAANTIVSTSPSHSPSHSPSTNYINLRFARGVDRNTMNRWIDSTCGRSVLADAMAFRNAAHAIWAITPKMRAFLETWAIRNARSDAVNPHHDWIVSKDVCSVLDEWAARDCNWNVRKDLIASHVVRDNIRDALKGIATTKDTCRVIKKVIDTINTLDANEGAFAAALFSVKYNRNRIVWCVIDDVQDVLYECVVWDRLDEVTKNVIAKVQTILDNAISLLL